MKITIESTDQIVDLVTPQGDVPARLWIGQTESGIVVQCLVTQIAAPCDADQAQFKRELKECAAPRTELPLFFPLRMVL